MFRCRHSISSRCSVQLPRPAHMTVALKGIGFINYTWAWTPPSDLQNPTKLPVRYESSFSYDNADWEGRKINPNLTRTEVLILNKGIHFRVKALLEPESCFGRESEWTYVNITAEKGDAGTAVTNFRCLQYNFEYINCTWDIGSQTPPDTVYYFHYWQVDMDVIQICPKDIFKDGRAAGCHLKPDKFNHKLNLNTRVTGKSAHARIKPFFFNLESGSFVKLCPPKEINISKTANGIGIKWKVPASWSRQCVNYQLSMRSSSNSDLPPRTFMDPEVEIHDAVLDVKNTVQVRAIYIPSCGDNGIWSDWSDEAYFGKDNGQDWILRVTLLIIVPILVAAAAIILLTYLKKLQILILPPIPDPGKLFKGMFGDSNEDYSTWSKPDKGILTLKPLEEITFKVTTVEKLEGPAERSGKRGENEGSEEEAFSVCVDEEIPVDDLYMNYNLVTS
uniref:interleukin-13 receptor subunit alpha-1-like isoform X2 n=1 Tax=Pristiophorus japonicus TaxID=55135 RepID=UPI00398F5570